MVNLRMGYIGKSFSLGILGIVGTLVACGGGGITSTVANTPVSPYVLFASADYTPVAGSNDNNWATAKTLENGFVNAFYPGKVGDVGTWGGNDTVGFDEGWDLPRINSDEMKKRQAVGTLATTTQAVDSSQYFGIAVKAPANASVNASESGNLVIQMGSSIGASTDSHDIWTVEIKNATVSCSKDVDLSAARGSGNWGAELRTYKLALAETTGNFTCTGGTLAALKPSIKEVVVKVVGGKDTNAPAATTTMIQVGMIGFTL